MTPPPPGAPLWSVRSHGVRTKRPGARSESGAAVRKLVLQRLEGGADIVTQRLEPAPRGILVVLKSVRGGGLCQPYRPSSTGA